RPDGREHLPERDLPRPAKLGRASVPQPHLLQRGRRGEPLRRLAGAGDLHDRGEGRVQVTAEELMSATIDTATAIRPFQLELSGEPVDDLRGLAATRLPTKEFVD